MWACHQLRHELVLPRSLRLQVGFGPRTSLPQRLRHRIQQMSDWHFKMRMSLIVSIILKLWGLKNKNCLSPRTTAIPLVCPYTLASQPPSRKIRRTCLIVHQRINFGNSPHSQRCSPPQQLQGKYLCLCFHSCPPLHPRCGVACRLLPHIFQLCTHTSKFSLHRRLMIVSWPQNLVRV